MHLPARSSAPIACDMSSAEDTPGARLREYDRLFERALLRRERSAGGVVFSFRADPGVREAVEDLARREAACCPFLDYRVETDEATVTWTISNGVSGHERAGAEVTLDAFHALPDHAGAEPPHSPRSLSSPSRMRSSPKRNSVA